MFRKIASVWRWLFAGEQYVSADGVAFRRHPNGGGWVASSATVDETAFVSRFAVVGPLAEVRRGCTLHWGVRIGVRAFVGMGTRLGCLVHIGDGSTVDHSCSIGRRSIIEHSVTVGHHVTMGVCALVCSGCKIGENSAYGDEFYAGKGVEGGPNAKELGRGFRLGAGYSQEFPVTFGPW